MRPRYVRTEAQKEARRARDREKAAARPKPMACIPKTNARTIAAVKRENEKGAIGSELNDNINRARLIKVSAEMVRRLTIEKLTAIRNGVVSQ